MSHICASRSMSSAADRSSAGVKAQGLTKASRNLAPIGVIDTITGIARQQNSALHPLRMAEASSRVASAST
jgi:hypothetical protein